MVERYNGEATSAPRPTCSFIAHSLGRLERLAWATNLIEVDRPKGAGTMETMGPIPNSDARRRAFPNVSPATHGPWAREERNGSARRPVGRGFSLAVGTMLAVLLISSMSSAETSPRGKLEDFFGQVTAVLSVATNAKQARDDVRTLVRALFDGRGAARQALGSDWDLRTAAEREEFTRMFTGVVEHAYLEV